MLLALNRHGPLALVGLLLLRRSGRTHARFAQGLMSPRQPGVVWGQATWMLLLDIGKLLLELRHHLLLRRVHHPPSTCSNHLLKLMQMVLRGHCTTLLLNLLLLARCSHTPDYAHPNALLLSKGRHVPLGGCLRGRRLRAHRCRGTGSRRSVVASWGR